MKIPGTDGIDYINVGPSHTTEVGRLLNLATELWFSTPHGRCLTLIGYHYYNTIKYLIDDNNVKPSSELAKHMELLLSASSDRTKYHYNECIRELTIVLGKRPKGMRYPACWQVPSIYARLTLLKSPIDEFYNSNLPIVWLDSEGQDLCDGRSKIGNYVETILKLRNDHVKYF